jgi:sn-glycerol 3-phosphate transport system permease protein
MTNTSMADRPSSLANLAAWLFAVLWALPLIYALWAALHPPASATHFNPLAPLTLDNFTRAWTAAPFARYFLNTILLVLGIMVAQFLICTTAAFGLARWRFFGADILFALILIQLMVTPDVLVLENYRTLQKLNLIDTLTGIGLPYVASAFGIFLLRQTFKSTPKELDDAARLEGAGTLQTIWRVYLPLARPTYVAYGLVSVSYHWNNFLWPLIVTNSVETRPLTVGLQVFASTDQGIDWSIICAAALMTSAPLMIAFLVFQRAFIQSFLRAGIR